MAFLLPYHLLSSLSPSLSTKFGTHKTWSATQSLCVVKGSAGRGVGMKELFQNFNSSKSKLGVIFAVQQFVASATDFDRADNALSQVVELLNKLDTL